MLSASAVGHHPTHYLLLRAMFRGRDLFFVLLQGKLMVHPGVIRVPSEHDKVGWLEEMAEGFGACWGRAEIKDKTILKVYLSPPATH